MCTPGEGGGEGSSNVMTLDPHPNPLPEYRERGPELRRLQRFILRFYLVGRLNAIGVYNFSSFEVETFSLESARSALLS